MLRLRPPTTNGPGEFPAREWNDVCSRGCYPPRSTLPPPPPDRGLDDDDEEPDEPFDPPLLDDEPLDELPDDGLLTDPDPPPRFEDDDDEPELAPLRVDDREPLLSPDDELDPRLSLGVSRAPPIEPMTRRTVSPEPRQELSDDPRVDVDADGFAGVAGRLTGSSPPPRVV